MSTAAAITTIPTIKAPNLPALTGLRFCAAFLVVVYHFSLPLLAGWPHGVVNIAGAGYVAVSLFFVLSGFVLSYSYLGREGGMRGSASSFYVSRFVRIYPAYLVAFLLALPVNVMWSMRVNSPATGILKLGFGGVLVLALMQAWTPWTAWYWNSPAWSLSAEAFFYFCFPLAGPRLATLRRSHCFLGIGALWMLALLPPVTLWAYRLWVYGSATGVPVTHGSLEMALEFTPLLRLPEFLIGVLAGRIFVLSRPLGQRASVALPYAACFALLGVLAASPAIPRPLLAAGLLTPLYAVLVYALAHNTGALARLLARPWMVLLGEASYGIYILQIPVSYCLNAKAPHSSWPQFAMFSIVLVAASLLCLRYVDGPVRRLLKKPLSHWLASRENPSAGETSPSRLAEEQAGAC